MFYLFDLDDTLIDTGELWAYRKNHRGRSFVAENPEKVPSKKIEGLADLVKELHGDDKVGVLTNSPRGYARALLTKHGFPEDLPLIGSANKPLGSQGEGIEDKVGYFEQEELVIIGDSPTDILAAHQLRAPSIAVTWGSFPKRSLDLAEPSKVVSSVSELVDELELHDWGISPKYQDHKGIAAFQAVAEYEGDPEIEVFSIGEYTPVGQGTLSEHSKRILAFKRSKTVTIESIREGAKDAYLWDGKIKGSLQFKDVINSFGNKAKRELEKAKLGDNIWVVPVPNSNPDYCYLLDSNWQVARWLTKQIGNQQLPNRVLYRVKPVFAAHNGGRRRGRVHYESVEVNTRGHEFPESIVLFDDVSTTGTTFETMAKILRSEGFTGNLYGLALGKTP